MSASDHAPCRVVVKGGSLMKCPLTISSLVETVAKAVGTIGYELVSKLTQRVKLEYIGE